MSKPLRIFTDGSYNHDTKTIGWAYVMVAGDTVLCADSGAYARIKSVDGANIGEHLAVMYALFALQTTTTAVMMIDADCVADLVNGQEFKHARLKGIGKFRNIIRRLCATHDITAIEIRSGSHQYNKYADTLARRACGLKSKNYMRGQQRKRAKRKAQELLDNPS